MKAPIYRLALISFLACILVISALPRNVNAIPFKIEGYLRNSEGVPIALANITITGQSLDPVTMEYSTDTHYRETDIHGYYVIYVAGNEPGGYPLGTEMTISYSTEDETVSNTITIQGMGAWANLTYDDAPPTEALTSPVAMLLIVVVVTVVLLAYFFTHSDKERPREDHKPRVERRRRSK